MNELAEWFAAIVREIHDNQILREELLWDEDDDRFAKRVHGALTGGVDGKVSGETSS